MGLRQVILRALAARGVGPALRERAALDRETAQIAAQLAPPPMTWSSAAPAEPQASRARLAEVDARRMALQIGLTEAFAEVARAHPPFEIAVRVEALVDLALREPSIGRAPSGAQDALSEELDALAWRIVDLWAPGFDPDAVAAAFADRTAWSRARPGDGPAREDAQLGWAPVSPDEVLGRATTVLAGQAFAALCASAEREAAEATEIAARLDEARGEVSMLAAIVGGGREERQRVDELAQRLERERHEANVAFEAAWLTAARAAEVIPPLRIHAALLAAASVIRGAPSETAWSLGLDGKVGRGTSACGRAVVLAALADVRAACDAAFPGLCVIASGGPAALRALLASGMGPYRAGGDDASRGDGPGAAVDARQVPTDHGGRDAHLLAVLDGAGAARAVERALEHGVALGVLERPRARPGLADRLVARTAPPARDAEAARLARATWHRAALLAQRRALVTGCVRIELPRTMLHEAIVQVHLALNTVRVVSLELGLGARLDGHERAMGAVDRLAFVSGAILGLPGGAGAIAEAVAARLRGGGRGSDAIEALATELRHTSFAPAIADLPRLAAAADEAGRAAGRSEEAVPWLDRVNIFGRSAAEAEADEAVAAADRAATEVQQAMSVAQDLFVRAVARFPAVALHVAIADVQLAVRWLRAVEGSRYTQSYVHGSDRAWQALRAWSAQAQAAVGPLESADDVLERYAASKLSRRAAYTR